MVVFAAIISYFRYMRDPRRWERLHQARERADAEGDHDRGFLAPRNLVAYTASKLLRAAGASVHNGYSYPIQARCSPPH